MDTYEFSAEQNELVNKLRRRLLYIAVLFVVIGVLHLLGVILTTGLGADIWLQGVTTLVLLLLGYAFSRPMDNLKRIVITQGSDIRELMVAMDDLRVAYLIAGTLIAVMSVVMIVEIIRGLY